ncbi:photosystem II cytochrome PsbV2 [Lusitaniella coriacea LEGE 07157]|uniref:Photosystem II cytochrome PsbV2 n=1 Tax=Lusitaniella coriacea LEGE 07157 TaxID=945747 RepID=A0A8J7DZ29_9CYAN|nr:photosystem II cytochrome PsbV2 [Lusitaniella coriacea]MBE9117048.1 photosystem II cytochrome PsbV2 [Lusitaniella coriacea LEGE 07157]
MTRFFAFLTRLSHYRGFLFAIFFASILFFSYTAPALAVSKYIKRFIASEPVTLDYDRAGNTKTFTPEDFEQGKELFKEHCIYCHVGGTTLQDPRVSLSTEDLAGATPPRDNVGAIVAFLREPMNYDGSEMSIWCRQVEEDWISQAELEKLAAFVIRAAQKSPGWGVIKRP